ncbi:MAG: MATE family efflux transporter [bacterium]|nr:MATE family efflux transporter [bacterium]
MVLKHYGRREIVTESALLPDSLSQEEIRRNIFRMIWPATTESVLQMLVGLAATAMVGRIGAQAVGAVGLSNRVTQIVWAIFSAIGTGATVMIARATGANDREAAKKTAEKALFLALGLVCVLTFLVVWQSKWLMVTLFGAKGSILEMSYGYLSLVAWGIPFMAIMQVSGAIMRGSGNTKPPMTIALIVNIINVFGNYSLIYGKMGFPALGIRGAAISAIVAQSIGAALALVALGKTISGFSIFARSKYSSGNNEVRKILGIGIPSAFESIFWQAATIVIMRIIVQFGTAELAAHQLGLTAESLSYMPSFAFGIATTTFVSQSLGACRPERAERYVKEILRFSILLTAVTASILFFFPKILMGVLTTDIVVINLGAKYLMLMAVAQIPMQVAGVLNGALRGAGDTKAPMIIGGTGLWLIRLPLTYALGVYFGLGIMGVWIAMTIDLFIRFCLTYYRYYKGKWKNIIITA